MKFRKIYFTKDPEIDITPGAEDLTEFFNHISGGGGSNTDDTSKDDDNSGDSTGDLFGDHENVQDDDGIDDDPRNDNNEDNPTDDEVVEDKEEVSVDPNIAAIAELREQNRKLIEMLQNTTTPKKEEKAPEPEIDLFSGDSFTKLTEELELNEGASLLFANFMKQYGAQVAKSAVKDAMDQTSSVVDNQITSANNARDMKKNFYSTHPALEAVQGYVAQIANTVAHENPNYTVDQVLEESANRSYSSLGINKDTIGKQEKPGKGKKPAFAKTPKARKPAPKRTKLDKELNAMIDLF